MLILNIVKVVCFDTVLQVLILKGIVTSGVVTRDPKGPGFYLKALRRGEYTHPRHFVSFSKQEGY